MSALPHALPGSSLSAFGQLRPFNSNQPNIRKERTFSAATSPSNRVGSPCELVNPSHRLQTRYVAENDWTFCRSYISGLNGWRLLTFNGLASFAPF